MSVSTKVGLHIIGGSSVPLGRPAVVKLVDPSSEYVAQVRQQVGPDTLIVVRWTQAEQHLSEPLESARGWCYHHGDQIVQMMDYGPIAFEGYNEVADQQAAEYCRFEVERIEILHSWGASAVVGNFSVGTPDLPTWAAYKPMLNAMGPGDFIGLHEYWADWESLHNIYHVRRFLRVPELAGKRIIITECGRDVVERRGQPGWKRSDMRVDSYIAELAELGRLYDACPQVVGACVFAVGNDPRWADYDVREIWPYVVQLYDAEPVEPEPEPTGAWAVKSQLEDEFDGERWRFTVEKWEAHHDEPDGDCSVRV